MGLTRIVLIFVLIVVQVIPAVGEPVIIRASNPQGIAAFLAAEGLTPELGVDDYGDPIIRIKHDRRRFAIEFYGCRDGQACQSVMIFAGYRIGDDYSIEMANKWNAERRWTRTYMTETGSARLEMDIFTGAPGIDSQIFANLMRIWILALQDFEEVIEW